MAVDISEIDVPQAPVQPRGRAGRPGPARLRMVGRVRTHREGRRMIYRLTSTHLVALIEEALGFAGHFVHDTPHHDQRTPSPAAPMTR